MRFRAFKFQVSKVSAVGADQVCVLDQRVQVLSTGLVSSTTRLPDPLTQKSQQQQQSSSSYNSSCDPSLSSSLIEDGGGGWRCVGAVNDPAADQVSSIHSPRWTSSSQLGGEMLSFFLFVGTYSFIRCA